MAPADPRLAPGSAAVNVLAREGEYWTVVFAGRVSRVRDVKGLHYLQHLLRHPGEDVHALALVAAVGPPGDPAVPGRVDRADGLVAGGLGDAGPVLDAHAIAAYRRRFLELREELADAEEADDEVRLGKAQDELDALAAQLAGGTGLGGRARRAGSPGERARLAVTKAVRAAVRRLEQADPELGRHLQRTVRTGTFCAYVPDPAAGVVWRSDPPGDPAPASRLRPARRTPFVGRALERGVVRELVAAAAGGRGGLLVLSGDAGIGKSRLAEEAVAEAEARGMVALVGRCVDVQPPIAWLPLVEVLERLFADLPEGELGVLLAGTGPQVAKVVPALRRRMPELPPPAEVPVEHERLFLYTSLRSLLLRLGSGRPALVILEDLHWADPATMQMLQHLVDGLEAARVLVIATYRSEEATLGTPLAQTVERLVRNPATTPLALGRMPPAEVVELVAHLTGEAPAPDLAGRVAAEAGGNPFFVEELVKHLAAERLISTGDVRMPESLRLLLGHKLQRLSPAARDLVNLVAVAGRDIDVDLVTAALGTDGERTVDAVDEALSAGVLVPVADRAGERLAFGHALLRQAALAELSTLRRRRLHHRLAGALRHRYGEDPEHAGEIADHLAQAGTGAEPAETLRFLELAGRRSLESAAYEDALDRFRRALELAPAGDAGARARLLAGLGYAQRGTGSPAGAHASWREALDLLEASAEPDRALAAELCRALGRYLDATGGLDQAVAVLQRGLHAVGPDASAERSRLTAALGYAHTLRGDIAGAAAWLDEASVIAEALDDDRLRADVLASRTTLAFATGRLRECVATAEAAELALLAAGQVWDAVQAKVTTAWPRLWLGDAGDARQHADQSLPMAERVGHVAAVFLIRGSADLVDLVVTGNLERFAGAAARGLAFCRDHRLRWLADAHVLIGLAEFWRGRWDVASDHLEAALTTPAPPVYAGRYGASLLTFLGWAGDQTSFDRVLATIRADLQRVGPGRTLGAVAVALAEVEGHALLGRHEAAAALYPAVVSALDAGFALRPPDLRIVDALAGVAAGLSGDHTLAGGHFERARGVVAKLPHPRQGPDLDLLEAVSLAGTGAPRARELVERAAAGYDALGMPRHRARAEAAMERLA